MQTPFEKFTRIWYLMIVAIVVVGLGFSALQYWLRDDRPMEHIYGISVTKEPFIDGDVLHYRFLSKARRNCEVAVRKKVITSKQDVHTFGVSYFNRHSPEDFTARLALDPVIDHRRLDLRELKAVLPEGESILLIEIEQRCNWLQILFRQGTTGSYDAIPFTVHKRRD